MRPHTQDRQRGDRNQNAAQAGSRQARLEWPRPPCRRLRARLRCPEIVFPKRFRFPTNKRRRGSKKSIPNQLGTIQFHIQIVQWKTFDTILSTFFQSSEFGLAKRAKVVTINASPLRARSCLFELTMLGSQARYFLRKSFFRCLKGELRYMFIWGISDGQTQYEHSQSAQGIASINSLAGE